MNEAERRAKGLLDVEKRPVTERELEACLGRARELERMGDEGASDSWYYDYGVRSFPVGDAMARYDVPRLVAEVKRLRGLELEAKAREVDAERELGEAGA
jgi:hypothetical protein